MTTAAQVQAAFFAANRTAGPDEASAAAIAAQIDSSGGTFTLNMYTNQQFELNKNTTGLALEIFSAIVGKSEASAADLTTVTNTQRSFLGRYSNLPADEQPQAAADELGAQLAANATGTLFRSTNGLSELYGPTPSLTKEAFDIDGFVTKHLTYVWGSDAATSAVINFEAQRFAELANHYVFLDNQHGATRDTNDITGYVRAAGALVAELINQGAQANNGAYHSAAIDFIRADAIGKAPYGTDLLSVHGSASGA